MHAPINKLEAGTNVAWLMHSGNRGPGATVGGTQFNDLGLPRALTQMPAEPLNTHSAETVEER